MIDWPSRSAVMDRLTRVGPSRSPAPDPMVQRLYECYLATYPAYLRYFTNQANLSADEVLVGAGMAFSWMPAPVKFSPEKLEASLPLLQEARSRKLDADELQQIRIAMGNSMVGASKLLHFIVPTIYPIWDSRICWFLLQTTRQPVIQDTKGYLRYQALCEEVCDSPGFDKLRKKAERICGYPVVPMRAVEFLMFMGAERDSEPSRKVKATRYT